MHTFDLGQKAHSVKVDGGGSKNKTGGQEQKRTEQKKPNQKGVIRGSQKATLSKNAREEKLKNREKGRQGKGEVTERGTLTVPKKKKNDSCNAAAGRPLKKHKRGGRAQRFFNREENEAKSEFEHCLQKTLGAPTGGGQENQREENTRTRVNVTSQKTTGTH